MSIDAINRGTGLDVLLATLAPMRRSYIEQGKHDWLSDPSCLAEFSDSALLAVAAELDEQWKSLTIRARPPRVVILSMLHAAQEMQQALDGLRAPPSRAKLRRRER